jgi:hypothetical protein
MKYLMANDTAYDEMLAWKVDGCVRTQRKQPDR